MVGHLSDDQLRKLHRGGHDPAKVYAAYKAAVAHQGSPTVILAKTIKGYGLGEAGEGRNITHSQKKLNEEELVRFRSRFEIPISDEAAAHAAFYRPPQDSPEMKYLRGVARPWAGSCPGRRAPTMKLKPPKWEDFAEFFAGSEGREVSTTMAFVRLLVRLMRDKNIGPHIVPIVPDEARTFGMEALFRQFGIYSHVGQLYEPVDSDTLLYYREAHRRADPRRRHQRGRLDVVLHRRGHVVFQPRHQHDPVLHFLLDVRLPAIGDLIWASGDMRCRGFLLGGTAGRTTLAGEGLQHQDGNSHFYAMAYPNVRPTTRLRLRDGGYRPRRHPPHVLRRRKHLLLPHPDERKLRNADPAAGRHRRHLPRHLPASSANSGEARVRLLGSGAILARPCGRRTSSKRSSASPARSTAQPATRPLPERPRVRAWNRLHPGGTPRRPYVRQVLDEASGPVVAALDYVGAVAAALAPWVGPEFTVLGADGFGRSEARKELRRFFEVDAENIVLATLTQLAAKNQFPKEKLPWAIQALGLDPEKPPPTRV